MEFQAVVLASCNDGDDLYPLTEKQPLALLPIANRPLLTYQLELLERAGGFAEVFVVATDALQPVIVPFIARYKAGSTSALRIEVLSVPEGFGSADALRHIAPRLTTSFVLISGEVVCDFPFQRLADLHRLHGSVGVTALFREREKADEYDAARRPAT